MARPLDWETHRNYTLLVNVTDGVHFISTTVHVRVTDVNEHRPQFLQRTFTASVPENAPPGTEVVRVTASDHDEERRLLFSIYAAGSPASQGKFHIDENSGVITTMQELDRETTAQHTLIIVVKDRGTASRGDLAKVLINVIGKVVLQFQSSLPIMYTWLGGYLECATESLPCFLSKRIV